MTDTLELVTYRLETADPESGALAAYLTLNDPARRNALSDALLDQLGELLQRALGFRARHSIGRRLGLVDTVNISAQFGHPNLPRHAARRSATLPQTWTSPSTSASMSASLCSGVGVIRNRSVPVGTVG